MSGLYCSIFPERYNKVFDKRIFSQQCYKVTNVTWCRPLTNNAPQQKFQNSSHLILSTLWELAGPRGKYIYRKSKLFTLNEKNICPGPIDGKYLPLLLFIKNEKSSLNSWFWYIFKQFLALILLILCSFFH